MSERLKAGLGILRDKGAYSFIKSGLNYLMVITYYNFRFILKSTVIGYSQVKGVRIENNKYLNNYIRGKIEKGEYEKTEIDFINNYIESEDNIVELGGGLGFTSCFVNNMINESSNHLVIEANPNLIDIINSNKSLNHSGFELIGSAYHSSEKELELYIANEFWSSSTMKRDGDTVTVSAVSLEDILSDFDFEDFVLISDIEGGEIELTEESRVLSEKCKLIIIEIHPEKCGEKEIKSLIKELESIGFKIVDRKQEVLVMKH